MRKLLLRRWFRCGIMGIFLALVETSAVPSAFAQAAPGVEAEYDKALKDAQKVAKSINDERHLLGETVARACRPNASAADRAELVKALNKLENLRDQFKVQMLRAASFTIKGREAAAAESKAFGEFKAAQDNLLKVQGDKNADASAQFKANADFEAARDKFREIGKSSNATLREIGESLTPGILGEAGLITDQCPKQPEVPPAESFDQPPPRHAEQEMGLPPNFEMSLVGGQITTSISGNNLISLDTLDRVAPLREQNLSSLADNGVVGGTVTVRLASLFFGRTPGAASVIFETGFLGRTGGSETSPVLFPTFAGGNGFASDPPKWTVPVLAGLSFPIGSRSSAKIAAGVNINRREASFSLRENGAGPTGLPISVSDAWTSVDPALDLGLQVGVGHLGALPVSVGMDLLFDWTHSRTLFAQSPNFPSQSYTMNTGKQMDIMLLFNVSLGLAPAPTQRAITRR